MTALPRSLHRMPHVFYMAAVVTFVISFWLGWSELSATQPYLGENPAYHKMLFSTAYRAAVESLYLIANGAIIHVLLAIYLQLSQDVVAKGAAE